MNSLLLQCSHTVIINVNKREVSKKISPFFFSDSSMNPTLLHENFLSLEVNKLFSALDYLVDDINQVEEEVQLFIFRKKETIFTKSHIDNREVSYFRMIFLKNNIPSYEDYDYNILFDRKKFNDFLYSKLKSFKQLLNLPLKELIDIKEYDMLLPPAIGGYFIHEVVGHLLESDNISIFKINDLVNCKFLSVTDDIRGYEDIIGMKKYDDNGVEIKKVQLIKNGKVINLIDEKSGFFRTNNILKKSMPRMRVTYVDNCYAFNYKCYEKYKNYVEISQIFGGSVDFRNGNYQLFVRGILYENGIPTHRIENLLLSGNARESLERIIFIGDDLKIVHAYCVKDSQMIDVAVGSPTMYLKKSGGI